MMRKHELSAGGIVYKKEGDQTLWLLVQLSSHKGWGFPKGHVGDKIENETYEAAAFREVKEEGGIETKMIDPKPIVIQYFFRRDGFLVKKHVYYFLMEYISGDIQDHDLEVADIAFLPEDKARATLSFKSDKKAFEEALRLYKLI